MTALRTSAAALAAVVALGLTAVLVTPHAAATYPSGSPGGFSGDQMDEGAVRTCSTSGCHDSYALNSGTGGVSIDMPSSVQPGQTVTVTVHVDNTTTPAEGSTTGRRQGFEAIARDAAGNVAGNLTITNSAITRTTFGSDPSVTHTVSGALQSSWTFNWTAPNAPAEVTFYAAGNAANGGSLPGEGSNSAGDYIYTTTRTVSVGPSASDESPSRNEALALSAPHPNPVRTGAAALRLTLATAGDVQIRIVDGRGRTVRQVSNEARTAGDSRVIVRTDGLAPGLYFVVAEAGADRVVQPLSIVR